MLRVISQLTYQLVHFPSLPCMALQARLPICLSPHSSATSLQSRLSQCLWACKQPGSEASHSCTARGLSHCMQRLRRATAPLMSLSSLKPHCGFPITWPATCSTLPSTLGYPVCQGSILRVSHAYLFCFLRILLSLACQPARLSGTPALLLPEPSADPASALCYSMLAGRCLQVTPSPC